MRIRNTRKFRPRPSRDRSCYSTLGQQIGIVKNERDMSCNSVASSSDDQSSINENNCWVSIAEYVFNIHWLNHVGFGGDFELKIETSRVSVLNLSPIAFTSKWKPLIEIRSLAFFMSFRALNAEAENSIAISNFSAECGKWPCLKHLQSSTV